MPKEPMPKKALKANAFEKKATNKFVKEMAKRGVNVGGSGSVSARKPSVPVKPSAAKAGAANKMKAQGSKSMSTPTMGYNKLGNKKK